MAQDPLKIAQGLPGPGVNQQPAQALGSPVPQAPAQPFSGRGQGLPLTLLEGAELGGRRPKVPANQQLPQQPIPAVPSPGMAQFAPQQPVAGGGDRRVPQQLARLSGLPEQYRQRFEAGANDSAVGSLLNPAGRMRAGYTLGERSSVSAGRTWDSDDPAANVTAPSTAGTGGETIDSVAAQFRGLPGSQPRTSTSPGETTRRYGDTEITEYTGANGERAFTNLPRGERDSFVPNAGSGAIAPDRGLVNAYNTAAETYRSMGPQPRRQGGGIPGMQEQLARRIANIDENSSIGEIRGAQAAGALLSQLQGNEVDQRNAQTARMQVMAEARPEGLTPYQQGQLQLGQQRLALEAADTQSKIRSRVPNVEFEDVIGPDGVTKTTYVSAPGMRPMPMTEFDRLMRLDDAERELAELEQSQGGR